MQNQEFINKMIQDRERINQMEQEYIEVADRHTTGVLIKNIAQGSHQAWLSFNALATQKAEMKRAAEECAIKQEESEKKYEVEVNNHKIRELKKAESDIEFQKQMINNCSYDKEYQDTLKVELGNLIIKRQNLPEELKSFNTSNQLDFNIEKYQKDTEELIEKMNTQSKEEAMESHNQGAEIKPYGQNDLDHISSDHE